MAKKEKPKTETGLAKPEPTALTKAEEQEMFGESKLDVSTGLSFNIVKIVRETAQFDLGNEKYVKSLTGHILFKHRANQWWEVPFDERGEEDDPMPQCYSINGFKPCGGSKIQAELCSGCPKDKFGSGKERRGKACRNTMRFLFLQDGAVLPIILMAPPTSLSKKGSLQHWLNSVPNDVAEAYNELDIKTKKGGPVVDYWPAHIELSLEKQEFAGGMSASLLCIKALDVVTPESNPIKLRQLFTMMKEAAEVYKAEQQTYIESETGDHSNGDATASDEAESGDDTPI